MVKNGDGSWFRCCTSFIYIAFFAYELHYRYTVYYHVLPSGNQTWHCKIIHSWMILLQPPFMRECPSHVWQRASQLALGAWAQEMKVQEMSEHVPQGGVPRCDSTNALDFGCVIEGLRSCLMWGYLGLYLGYIYNIYINNNKHHKKVWVNQLHGWTIEL